MIGSLNNTPEAQRKKAEDNAKVVVTVLCEQAVKQRLKAPGTADFPFGDATNVEVLETTATDCVPTLTRRTLSARSCATTLLAPSKAVAKTQRVTS